jgi:hypothetical protein
MAKKSAKNRSVGSDKSPLTSAGGGGSDKSPFSSAAKSYARGGAAKMTAGAMSGEGRLEKAGRRKGE